MDKYKKNYQYICYEINILKYIYLDIRNYKLKHY